MSFVNALVAAAKNAGVSPGKLYAQAIGGDKELNLKDDDKFLEDAKYIDPFEGLSTQELYMIRPTY